MMAYTGEGVDTAALVGALQKLVEIEESPIPEVQEALAVFEIILTATSDGIIQERMSRSRDLDTMKQLLQNVQKCMDVGMNIVALMEKADKAAL